MIRSVEQQFHVQAAFRTECCQDSTIFIYQAITPNRIKCTFSKCTTGFNKYIFNEHKLLLIIASVSFPLGKFRGFLKFRYGKNKTSKRS